MNPKILFFIFFTLSTLSSLAQTDIKFGVKGGLNLSGFHTGESANTDQISFHLGGISELRLNNSFSLHTELLYNQKGGLIHLWTTNRSIQMDSKLHYIDVPLLIKFFPIKNLSLDLGPQAGFLVYNKETLNSQEDNIKFSNTNIIDFSLAAGLSYSLNQNFLIQTRYNYGLTEIFGNERYKNSVVSLSLGYFIN